MDTPDPEPGVLHIDLKGPFPLSVSGKFRYAAFVIDEYSRFVFVEFLHDKSEVIEATKRIMAKFNALVGTPVDENGVALLRPKVRRLHRDHEGGLESRQFEAFGARHVKDGRRVICGGEAVEKHGFADERDRVQLKPWIVRHRFAAGKHQLVRVCEQ